VLWIDADLVTIYNLEAIGVDNVDIIGLHVRDINARQMAGDLAADAACGGLAVEIRRINNARHAWNRGHRRIASGARLARCLKSQTGD
jgi:hypothetical protein